MVKRVHFLGIGGSGASAAAAIAQAQGFEVNGCDLEPKNEFTTHFKTSQLLKDHSPKHLNLQTRSGGSDIDILAVTPAIYSLDPDNPELVAAKKQGIEILTWQEFMGKYLMENERSSSSNKFVIAVAGTHGKTTTTAMIAKLLEDTKLDPTVLVGAIVPWWSTNYRIQRQTVHDREYFVIEADEYNDNFLAFTPDISVVTNIEMDHPEYFKDFQSYKESFKKFLLQTRGTIVANLSDSTVAEVVQIVMKTPIHKPHDREIMIQYSDYSKNELNFPLKVPGEFNKLNASAAFQVGLLLGIQPKIIQKSLSSYPGVGRRFEFIGEYESAKVYSDFGHHPTEIQTTMHAVREKFPKNRILLIYQPHMFTRTKYLFDDFVKVFKEIPADKIFVMDIYKSREVDKGEVTSKQLVGTVNMTSVSYIGSPAETLENLKPKIKDRDIIFFMSAGDTDKLAKELVAS